MLNILRSKNFIGKAKNVEKKLQKRTKNFESAFQLSINAKKWS